MKLFIICGPRFTFRRENMKRRIANLKLTSQTQFIDGGNAESDLVRHYAEKDLELNQKSLSIVACIIGHLRAIRAFLKTGDQHGCILEDDVLFRDDFVEKLEEYRLKYKGYNLIQLYNMSTSIDCLCRNGIFGAQGYIIRHDYARKALVEFDKPLRYWPNIEYLTSEVILMYSNGICLGKSPIIIEDGLSYSITGNIQPNKTQKIYQLYAYGKGLDRFVDCDPDFKISAAILVELTDQVIRKKTGQIFKIIQHTQEPKTPDEEFILSLLQMFAGWYVDQEKAQIWADRFFRLISRGKVSKMIQKYKYWSIEVPSFYQPSFTDRIKISADHPEAEWSDSSNWLLVPNAPFERENGSVMDSKNPWSTPSLRDGKVDQDKNGKVDQDKNGKVDQDKNGLEVTTKE